MQRSQIYIGIRKALFPSAALLILFSAVGCTQQHAHSVSLPKGGVPAVAYKPRLGPDQAKMQIESVTQNKQIPENMKAQIIAKIKHDAGIKN